MMNHTSYTSSLSVQTPLKKEVNVGTWNIISLTERNFKLLKKWKILAFKHEK